MERAIYDIIEEEGSYWGEIPGLQGVWARQTTLESCRMVASGVVLEGRTFGARWR
jgi:predicted RNase H-like HicB family nuclease